MLKMLKKIEIYAWSWFGYNHVYVDTKSAGFTNGRDEWVFVKGKRERIPTRRTESGHTTDFVDTYPIIKRPLLSSSKLKYSGIKFNDEFDYKRGNCNYCKTKHTLRNYVEPHRNGCENCRNYYLASQPDFVK